MKAQGADCFFFAGIVSNGAVQITKDINAAVPTAKIFGGDGVCTRLLHRGVQGRRPGHDRPADPVHGRDPEPGAYPGGKDFLAAYKAKYGVGYPDPYAIYGYEAMKLGPGHHRQPRRGRQQQGQRCSRRCSRPRTARSVLGTYGFDKNGDTTLKSYGLYKVGADGEPAFSKTARPPTTRPSLVGIGKPATGGGDA